MEKKENYVKKQGTKTEKIRTGIVATYYAVDLQRLTAMPRLMPKRSRETGIATSVSV